MDKRINSNQEITVNQKNFNLPTINMHDLEDMNIIIDRLKKYYIKELFSGAHELKLKLPQICVMFFRSNKVGFDSKYIYSAFIRHFVDPNNDNKQVAMSIQKEPFIVQHIKEDSITPLKLSFLNNNINNAIMMTFTEKENTIDGEIFLFKGDNRPVFDYYRDVKFEESFNPYNHGYIPYIIDSKQDKFEIIK